MRLRLALADDLAQQLLKRLHVVVLEHAHVRSAQPDPVPNRGVVELVRDDEAALADETRDDVRVCRETHGANERILHTEEPGDERLRLLVQIKGPAFETGAASGNAIPPDARLHRISARAVALRETEIVVRRNVERAGACASGDHRLVVVGRVPVQEHDGTPWDASDGVGETVIDTKLETTRVERVEVRVERGITLKHEHARHVARGERKEDYSRSMAASAGSWQRGTACQRSREDDRGKLRGYS